MIYFTLISAISIFGFFYIKKHFLTNKVAGTKLAALPNYYGYCTATWCFITNIIFIIFLSLTSLNLGYSAILICLLISAAIIYLSKNKLSFNFNARKHFEKNFKIMMRLFTLSCILITLLIIISILFESLQFFKEISLFDFLFGLQWSPQIAIRADQAGSSGAFGVIPVFLGTLLITFIAMIIAGPLGLASAIYLTEYASKRSRKILKPMLEILAGIPTVVYGYFAAFTVAPAIVDFFAFFNLSASSESALAAGVVMGIMIIPFVLSLSDDVMAAVPKSLRDASYGLGSTTSETIAKVIIPAALPGIIGALLLAISRAIGETMIVVMAAGLTAHLSINPLDSVTTATAQIVTLLVGDQEFDSVKTLSAFALGLVLFVFTLTLNIIALIIVKKYREKYD
jgi:phosphate transport system permease protein